jgi:hypothetical protein
MFDHTAHVDGLLDRGERRLDPTGHVADRWQRARRSRTVMVEPLRPAFAFPA